MAFVIADGVKEVSTSTGTGPMVVAGAGAGFRPFSEALAHGDTTIVFIRNQDNESEWEISVVEFDVAGELTRTEVLASSNAGAAVEFSAGTKAIGIAPSASDVASIRAGANFLGPLQVRGETIDLDGGEDGQLLRRVAGAWVAANFPVHGNEAHSTAFAEAAALIAHATNDENPHGVTKTQVSLGDVENLPLASEAEAEAGEVNTRYMTPLRTAQAIAELAGGGGGGGGGGLELLERLMYNPSTAVTIASSTTQADADATNLAITFDAPASGDVLVVLRANSHASNGQGGGTGGGVQGGHRWGIREATTDVAGPTPAQGLTFQIFGTDPEVAYATHAYAGVSLVVTGLSSGSHTYKWAHSRLNNTAVLRIGGNWGPAIMEVYALP